MISTLEAPVYVERVALCDSKHIMQARKAVKKALELQKQGAGFTMVEILSPCPTILKMDADGGTPLGGEFLTKQFPLGVFRDRKPEFMPVTVPQKSVAELLGITGERPRKRAPRAAATYPCQDHQDCRLWWAGRVAARPVDRRDGHARAHGSELAAELWSGDALGQRALPRDRSRMIASARR